LGLALSLTCVITIFRYVYGEFTVDRHNKKLDRIYLIAAESTDIPGKISFRGLYSENSLDIVKHPGVEKTSNFIRIDNDNIEVDGRSYNTLVLKADSNFFQIIDYPVASGTYHLTNPKSALITFSFAKKIFGNQNPVGETFRYSNGDMLTITSVIGETSTKSTLTFDLIVSYHLQDPMDGMRTTRSFVLLYPDIDYRTINKQHETFVQRGAYSEQYQLFPLSKVYFYSKGIQPAGLFKQGNYDHVTIFIAVGILIMLAGIVNYVNIFTVVVLRRGREIGVKKVFGAGKRSIFMQLVTENFLLTGISIAVAWIVTGFANSFIVNVLRLDQTPDFHFDVLLSFLLILSLPLLTTLYPFLRHHFSTPVDSLHNLDRVRDTGGLRRIFLSFQYMITFVMIIVSLFFVKQLRFMMDSDPGFRTQDIIKASFKKPIEEKIFFAKEDLIPAEDGGYRITGNTLARLDAERAENQRLAGEITQKMNACPLFTFWTNSNSPLDFSTYPLLFRLPNGEFQEISHYAVNENWLKLFDMKLIAGRLWDDKTEVEDHNTIIVTESFLKLFRITDFNNVLLQVKRPPLNNNDLFSATTKIVGVIKDINYLHLSQKSVPVAMYYSSGVSSRGSPMNHDRLTAAIVPGRTQDAVEYLRRLHDETVGGEFTFSFLADEMNAMYKEDKKIASIYSLFTFIAILVSALGLFSMSLFDIRQRRKEIAIRKINGASFSDIIRLLLKKYIWTAVVSFIISAPISLYAIHRYLEDFANKAPVSWGLFAVAVIVTVGISLLTLLYKTQKAANQNPAEVIKA
jgi:ABC-type antimicrobial peptide transport system permease subunit